MPGILRAHVSTDVREEVYEELGVNRNAASTDQGHYIRSFTIARRRGRGVEGKRQGSSGILRRFSTPKKMWGGSCGSRKWEWFFWMIRLGIEPWTLHGIYPSLPSPKNFYHYFCASLANTIFFTWVGLGPLGWDRPTNFLDMLMYSA
jgi:hypothetical protein